MKPNAYAVCCVLALSSATSWANGFAPEAGNMMANHQDMLASRASAPPEGFPLEYYPKLRWTDDFSIHVEHISIEGNSLVAPQKLQMAVKDFVGKRMLVGKLSAVSTAVAKAYKDSGYRVKAYIPEQTFARGRLVVQVIEADPISR